jgi:hypothetical protein
MGVEDSCVPKSWKTTSGIESTLHHKSSATIDPFIAQ